MKQLSLKLAWWRAFCYLRISNLSLQSIRSCLTFFALYMQGLLPIKPYLQLTKSCFCCCCSVAKSCLTLCDPMDCSKLGSSVLHCLPEFTQIHVHWVSDAIQPSHPLLPLPPLAFSLSQHQGLFQRLGSFHQVAKVLELQLQQC